MPLTVSNPRDLFLAELGDLLFVERMLASEVLPDLISQVSDPELAGALAEHLRETKRHVERVESAFRAVDAEPSSNHAPAFTGLKDHHAELAGSIKRDDLADLFHAMAAAQTEHAEIARYRALIPLARRLGAEDAVAALEANLADEERALDGVEGAIERLSGAAA